MITLGLLNGMDEDEKGDLKESFLRALKWRKTLNSFLGKKVDANRKKSRQEKFILEGDFALKTAWAMGYEQAVEEFRELLESDPEK